LIALIVRGDSVLVVPARIPANTVQEFIALAKEKPGKLKAGTAGLGSSGHMALELFKIMGNIDIVMVHYKGAGAALTDLLGGYIDISNQTIQAALPHIKTGRIKALGVGGPKRSEIAPDVPTVDEQGLPGYYTTGWRGLIGPAGIPAPIIDRLTREMNTILTTDKVKMHFKNHGMETDYKGPRDFAVFISDEMSRLADVVRKANIKLETK
jgi:tripartite-type tricarboxylate transporter receptor subunit TctC